MIALVVLIGLALAATGYLVLERLGKRAILPASLRAVAWLSLGLLLVNPSCPIPVAESRPLVLLDGSLSMVAAGGQWQQALAAARATGQVRLFGDPGQALDSLPLASRSELAPALAATRASGRGVVVITDGELDDSLAVIPLLRGVAVRILARHDSVAVAIQSVQGQSRLTQRDTLRLKLELRAVGLEGPKPNAVVVASGDRTIATHPLTVENGLRTIVITVPGRALGQGEHVLRLSLRNSIDAERRDNSRLHLVSVAPTPGVVLAASPGDWDSRFLYRTLREVTDLPVEGYVELARGQWRRMSDLSPVEPAHMRKALGLADLAIVRGSHELTSLAQGRAVLNWPSPNGNDEAMPGDWYLSTGEGPPAAALAGMPVDSFAPTTVLIPLTPDSGDWIGASVQLGRRGAQRPAVIGSSRKGRRVTIGAQGLWRWAFRGGSSEQAYRALFASLVDWLVSVEDTARGRARPVREVVPNSQPVQFIWTASGVPQPVPIRIDAASGGSERADTLRFDGAGRASLRLAPGVYRYRLDGGGRGIVAVEEYSEEWFPRPAVLTESAAGAVPTERRQGIRERWWLALLAVVALCGEWVVRRRMGLR